MKTYTVRITRQAREHLRGIKSYIAEELLVPDAARSTMTALKKEIKSLSKMCIFGLMKTTERHRSHP